MTHKIIDIMNNRLGYVHDTLMSKEHARKEEKVFKLVNYSHNFVLSN